VPCSGGPIGVPHGVSGGSSSRALSHGNRQATTFWYDAHVPEHMALLSRGSAALLDAAQHEQHGQRSRRARKVIGSAHTRLCMSCTCAGAQGLLRDQEAELFKLRQEAEQEVRLCECQTAWAAYGMSWCMLPRE